MLPIICETANVASGIAFFERLFRDPGVFERFVSILQEPPRRGIHGVGLVFADDKERRVESSYVALEEVSSLCGQVV